MAPSLVADVVRFRHSIRETSMSRRSVPCALAMLLVLSNAARAYVEVPYSLGRVVQEASTIVLVEVARVNTEKNLVLFKKVRDLKGSFPGEDLRHNIGRRGFHEREWKNVMAWATPGKKAVFLHQGDASETCIENYWYQAYREGEWWGMSHAEPYLLRTFYGDPEKLAALIERMVKGQEVVATCLADGNRPQLHERKGRVQRLKASLKKLDYDAKRDFVGFGGDGDVIEEFATVEVLKAGSEWRHRLAESPNGKPDDRWIASGFADRDWQPAKTPIGYGEEELTKRGGTLIAEKGRDYLFRRTFDVSDDLLTRPKVVFSLSLASDNNAVVYLNGTLLDDDQEADHEFAYWNRSIEIPRGRLTTGTNTLAIRVRNTPMSSDLYFDAELSAEYPLPPKRPAPTAVAASGTSTARPAQAFVPEPRDPAALQVDKQQRTVTIACAIAPRKLPHLEQRYPIEVAATFPSPRGQKAHETIVTFRGVRPSDVHAALVELGLKPGRPALGETGRAEGPPVQITLEFAAPNGTQRLPLERCLVQRDSREPPPPLRWVFTGSVPKQPDPEKDEQVYGADVTGTLLALFPVTDTCVLQTQLTMADESKLKLDTNSAVLPGEGTAAKLILTVPQ